eukprot:1167641-Amphidinium_carterae.1
MRYHHDMRLNGDRALRVLSCFGLLVNSAMGVLPRSSVVQVSKDSRWFAALENRFTGTFPNSGMQAMMA